MIDYFMSRDKIKIMNSYEKRKVDNITKIYHNGKLIIVINDLDQTIDFKLKNHKDYDKWEKWANKNYKIIIRY